MADSSTATAPILNLIAGGCWAQRQLRSGIKNVSVASKLRKSLTLMRVVFIATPVNPSVQSVGLRVRTGWTAYLRGRPGRTGILASVRKTAREGRAGTTGVSGGGICGEPPRDDGWP